MIVQVFIQNEAGSNRKNYHDEKTLAYRFTTLVSRPYPYAYGFIVGTTGEDGCNADCFVITHRPLKTGQIVECEVLALMEQVEDGKADHNVLAVLPGENLGLTAELQRVLTEFVSHVFDHVDGKRITVGRFLGRDDADAHILACLDEPARSTP